MQKIDFSTQWISLYFLFCLLPWSFISVLETRVLVLELDHLGLNPNFTYWLYDLEQVTLPLHVLDLSSENVNDKNPYLGTVHTLCSNYDN